MTQEDKKLLLKDLYARIPYSVKVRYQEEICSIDCICSDGRILLIDKYGIQLPNIGDNLFEDINEIKPYLRQISSMTEEEFKELKEYSGLKYEQLDLASYQNGTYKCLDFYLSEVPSYVVILVFDWFNINHFDYRGLIEQGLALKAPDEIYNN